MAEDDPDIVDVERVILTGRVVRIQRDDPRGNKFGLDGMAADGTTLVGGAGRFPRSDRYLIVTVYKITGI